MCSSDLAMYWAGGACLADIVPSDGELVTDVLTQLGVLKKDLDLDNIFINGPARTKLEIIRMDEELFVEQIDNARWLPLSSSARCGSYTVTLPDWLKGYLTERGKYFLDPISSDVALSLAIEMALLNVQRRSGGPFGSVITLNDSDGTERLLSVGLNRVFPTPGSLWHGEMTAIHYLLAQINADESGVLANLLMKTGATLYTNACTCIQCAGAVINVLTRVAGRVRVIYAATQAEVEKLTTFDEGKIREAHLMSILRAQGVEVVHSERSEALEALRLFGEQVRVGTTIAYNANGKPADGN